MRGGIDVPEYLGSRATFTLGSFGGHGGRALRAGDVLRLAASHCDAAPAALAPRAASADSRDAGRSACSTVRTARRISSPTRTSTTFFATDWEVHYNSDRTGVRLIGPKPEWARTDGGEAGLHPSNIHDNAYAVGTVDFTGDMPIILGPDGPSLGGFVCPATIVQAELWKIGQLRPGDTVRFVPLAHAQARAARRSSAESRLRSTLRSAASDAAPAQFGRDDRIVGARARAGDDADVVYRPAGDRYLLDRVRPARARSRRCASASTR